MRAMVLSLALLGCGKADSLAVVTVDAASTIENIAVLHATMTAGSTTHEHDVGSGPFSIPPAKTFGVQLPSSFSGTFQVHVDARDATGALLASGDGETDVSPGKRSDLTITLGAAPPSDGGVDLATGDAAVDGFFGDLLLPPILSEPIWLGSGGSASSTTQQLNLNVGGTDTVGPANATSGATFTPGFFVSQTY